MPYFEILKSYNIVIFYCVCVCPCAYAYVDMSMFVHVNWDREGFWFYDLSLSSLFLNT